MKILSLDQLSVLKNKSMSKCRTIDTYCLGLEARHHRVGELDICFPVGVLYRLQQNFSELDQFILARSVVVGLFCRAV